MHRDRVVQEWDRVVQVWDRVIQEWDRGQWCRNGLFH